MTVWVARDGSAYSDFPERGYSTCARAQVSPGARRPSSARLFLQLHYYESALITSSVSGGFLLRLQARYRLARAVQHFRAHLDSPRGRTARSRRGRRASGVAAGRRAQLQRTARVIRAPAARATLRHRRDVAGTPVSRYRRISFLNEQQSRDNRTR